MKKLFKILVVTLCAALCLTFIACAEPGAPEHDTASPSYAAGIAESIASELEAFVTENRDRTTFKHGEENAAEYLAGRLTEFGYTDVTTQEFSVDENNVKGLISHNVFAKLKGGAENGKNVVLGAYYDNRYSEAYSNAITIKSESALAGGSGVASLLAVAQYLIENHGEENPFDFDVTIVFFGASYLYTDGSEAYLREGMTSEERRNTVLMVEMQRLGVDHVYAYSDARETKREGFFDSIACDNALAIYKPTQKSPAILDASPMSGIPYYQWAHGGVFSVFAEADIPTLNLVGANWETMNLGDAESAAHENISYTEKDTLKTLARYYPDYANKMATAATLIIRSLEAEDFLSTMIYDREHYPHTDILTTQWIWYLVAVGVLAIAFAIVFGVNAHLAKKYKPEPQKAPRLKMAVFGMDYEDKSAADIFIDIQKQHEEIFPGIPNNDSDRARPDSRGAVPPFGNAVVTQKTELEKSGEIFEGESADNAAPENKADIDPFESAPAPTDNSNTAIDGTPESEQAESTAPAEDNSDNAVPLASNADAAPDDSAPAAEGAEHAAENVAESTSAGGEDGGAKRQAKRASAKKSEPRIEIVKPANKRPTVSAKKSVGAKKSTTAGENKSVKKDAENPDDK